MNDSRRLLLGVLVSAALIGASIVGVRASASDDEKVAPTAQPPFKPVLSIHDMMEGQGKLSREIQVGILEKKWEDAAKSASILAEIANVNQYQNDDSRYRAFAKQMSQDSLKLAQVLKGRDEKSSREAFTTVTKTCSACHDVFKKD